MAKYPDINAGDKLTATLLGSMIPTVIVKSSIEIKTGTTLALDSELFFTAEANATYLIDFLMQMGAIQTEDVKTDWTVPSGASGFKAVTGPGSSASDSAADNIAMRAGVHNYGTVVTYAGVRDNASNAFTVREWSVVTTTNSGTIGIRWAQNATGSSTGVHVLSGSFMRIRRLA